MRKLPVFFAGLALISFSARAETPKIRFTRDVILNKNGEVISNSVLTKFSSKDHPVVCKVWMITEPFTQPTIRAGRELAVDAPNKNGARALFDPATNKMLGFIECDGDGEFDDQIEETLGAVPTGGIKKVDVKYEREEKSDEDSSVAL